MPNPRSPIIQAGSFNHCTRAPALKNMYNYAALQKANDRQWNNSTYICFFYFQGIFGCVMGVQVADLEAFWVSHISRQQSIG